MSFSHSKNESPAEVTFEGLYGWYRNLFKRSGWMILALDKGQEDSIQHFLLELEHLQNAIIHRKKRVVEKDRKDDLDILYKNLETLKKHFRL